MTVVPVLPHRHRGAARDRAHEARRGRQAREGVARDRARGRRQGLRGDRRSLPRGGERRAQRRSHPARARCCRSSRRRSCKRIAAGEPLAAMRLSLAPDGAIVCSAGGCGMMVRARRARHSSRRPSAAALVVGAGFGVACSQRYARHRPAAEVLHVAGRRHDDHRVAEDQPRGRREPAPRPAAPLPAEDRHAAAQTRPSSKSGRTTRRRSRTTS